MRLEFFSVFWVYLQATNILCICKLQCIRLTWIFHTIYIDLNQTSSQLLWIFSQWNVLFGVLLFRKTKYSYNCSLDAKISKQCWCCVRSHSAYIWHSFTQCVLLQRSTLITFECEKKCAERALNVDNFLLIKIKWKITTQKQKNTTTG